MQIENELKPTLNIKKATYDFYHQNKQTRLSLHKNKQQCRQDQENNSNKIFKENNRQYIKTDLAYQQHLQHNQQSYTQILISKTIFKPKNTDINL